MVSQTITLIRYFLTAYSSRKNFFLLISILLAGLLSSQFIAELSLSQAANAQLSFQIEFYRYALIIFSVLILVVSIAEDYESRQFEMLLSMPLSRWQYIVGQISAVLLLNLLMCVLAGLLLLLQSPINVVFYWLLSFWLEMTLVSFIALLAIISLEKIPSAIMLTLCLYLLSRISDSVLQIITMSVEYSDESMINVVLLMVFEWVQLVLPSTSAFLSNNAFFELSTLSMSNLSLQGFSVLVYCAFILSVTLFDFYRKDFSLN